MNDGNETRWQEVDRLFEAALELQENERPSFLDRECTDPLVRARVERLLTSEAASRGTLEPSTMQAAFMDMLVEDLASGGAPPKTEIPDRVGKRVGAYRLEELVGQGGMSTVYAAQRVEGGFEQRAAIKLIRTDANTEELVRQFESERAILSGLRHPNIARLLDGGSTPEGVPYLAMDFVEGVPINEWVMGSGLDVEGRLWLILEVASAVSYAHRNLVVHRDLKPSNILVDNDGHPMLLDFGIAKFLTTDGVVEGVTQTRARWMTPGYAAPEQIEGGAVTTGTDVYQLGVLLFELLTDRRPFEADGRSTYELERAICEEDPPHPSAVAPSSVRDAVAGDLDAIVLKAMRKESAERYPSVEAFAADIRRHLTAEPVEAHRGGLTYRARKFVRRHRAGVAAAAAALLLVSTWAVTATVQRQQIAAERDRAELESEKATQVTAFLTSLLQAENPREAQGTDPTLRDILQRGVERIGTELADQPEVQAELYLTTGDVYEALGEFTIADSLLDRAVEIRANLYAGGPNEELAEAQLMLGRLRMEQARFDEAVQLMESSLEQRRALYPAGTEAIADDMVELGDALGMVERSTEAMAMFEGAMAIYAELDSVPLASIGVTRNNVALVHHQAGRLSQAMPLYEQAVDDLMEDVGPRHPYTLVLQHNLAGLNRSLGRLAIADSIFQQVVAMELEVNGENPDAASAMANLGITLRRRGRLEEAAEALTRALAIQERVLQPSHPSVTLRMRNLAHVRIEQGQFDEAERLLREFGRRSVARSGPDGEISMLQDLGIVARKAGRLQEARATLANALARRRAQFEAPHPAISEVLMDLAITEADAGRYDQALEALDQAVQMTRDRGGGEGSTLGDVLLVAAGVALDDARLDRAEGWIGEVGPILDQLPGGTGLHARHRLESVRLQLAKGDTVGALGVLEELRPWFERQYVEGHDALTKLDEVEQEARKALSG